MISVLIPIHNYDVTQFVTKIHSLLEKEKINFEIVLFDDNSDYEYSNINSKLIALNNVFYKHLEQNIGRAKIRNLLAENAIYENLLFADCDMEIISDNFISNYLSASKNNQVICGGIKYKIGENIDKENFLRLKYGINREQISAQKRNKNKYGSFMTGNFFIKKNVFEKIKFLEKLTVYGHEDTIFGLELKENNVEIFHIENNLYHCGIDKSEDFIVKIQSSLTNLFLLYSNINYKNLISEVRIIRTFKKFYFAKSLISFLFKISNKLILNNLKGKNPNLYLLDFYKLGFFINLNKPKMLI
jgi:glycosyltransferase involved in cell wall biosynthesis